MRQRTEDGGRGTIKRATTKPSSCPSLSPLYINIKERQSPAGAIHVGVCCGAQNKKGNQIGIGIRFLWPLLLILVALATAFWFFVSFLYFDSQPFFGERDRMCLANNRKGLKNKTRSVTRLWVQQLRSCFANDVLLSLPLYWKLDLLFVVETNQNPKWAAASATTFVILLFYFNNHFWVTDLICVSFSPFCFVVSLYYRREFAFDLVHFLK